MDIKCTSHQLENSFRTVVTIADPGDVTQSSVNFVNDFKIHYKAVSLQHYHHHIGISFISAERNRLVTVNFTAEGQSH